MKKIFHIIALITLMFSNSFADELNPTNEWLKHQTVNTLTQEYGYTLKFFSGDSKYTNYILEKRKNKIEGNETNIIVTCTLRSIGASGGIYCFLP